MPNVTRTGLVLKPDSARVLLRSFNPNNDQRSLKIVARVIALPEEAVHAELAKVMAQFEERHHQVKAFLMRRFHQIEPFLITDAPLSDERKWLLGSYFTLEYALESAALFNPSLVWHPDQSGLPEGSKRFIVSLRATGEGHLSSITFREGVVDAKNALTIAAPNRFVTAPEIVANPTYDHPLFERKLSELGHWDEFTATVLGALNPLFTLEELKASIANITRQNRSRFPSAAASSRSLLTLAQANYAISYAPDQPLSERIIFPTSPTELNGIEDARFVEFHEDDGSRVYYANYTAYDGTVTMPQILKTEDFLHFEMSTLNGPEVQNKGMALFPCRVNGLYAMLSRQDNENIYIMFSDNIHFWYTKELLVKPTYPWEFVQLGNCGSPIDLGSAWLVLTHGVGPMRRYVIGAVLLDRKDPTRVIGRLAEPLISPDSSEREGYVPNVLYSCGAQVHNGSLILPYALSDYASTFAVIPVEDILRAMK